MAAWNDASHYVDVSSRRDVEASPGPGRDKAILVRENLKTYRFAFGSTQVPDGDRVLGTNGQGPHGRWIAFGALTTGTALGGYVAWKGDWNDAEAYEPDDLVVQNDTGYVCLVANTNVSPDTDPVKWQVLSRTIPDWQTDIFTVAVPGQTVFTLTHTPVNGTTVLMFANGIAGAPGIEFTCIGTTLTWLNLHYQFQVGDIVMVYYRR